MEPEKQKDLKTVFDSFDKDKSGSIEINELKQVAIQLGQQIPQEELTEIMAAMDINGDGKISFKQFKNWWEKGVEGKMKKLVILQGKALQLTTFASKFLKSASGEFSGEAGANIQTFSYSVGYGDKESNIDFKIQLFIKGAKFQNKVQQLTKQYVGFNPDLANFVTTLYFSNPQQMKKIVEEQINNANKQMEQSGMSIDLFVNINLSVVGQNGLRVCVTSTEMSQAMIDDATLPIRQFIETLGNDFFFNLTAQFVLDGKLQEYKSAAQFIDALLLGFKFLFQLETSKNIIDMVKSQGEIPPDFPFLNSKNITKVLKTPQQLQQFLKELGINEHVENAPNITHLAKKASQKASSSSATTGKQELGKLNQIAQSLFSGQEFKAEIYVKTKVVVGGFSFKVKQPKKLYEEWKN